MSVRLMGAVFGLELAPREKLVLLALADHADHDGGGVHPSVERLGRMTGYDRRTVQRTLRALVDAGLIVAVRDGGGRARTGHYELRIPRQRDAVSTGNSGSSPPFGPANSGDVTPLQDANSGDVTPLQAEKGGILTEKGGSLPPEPFLTVEHYPLTPIAAGDGGTFHRTRTPRDRGSNPRARRRAERMRAGAANLGRLYRQLEVDEDDLATRLRREYVEAPELVEVALRAYREGSA